MITRKCCTCFIVKPLSGFYKNKREKHGHTYECISCSLRRAKTNWLKKKDKPEIKQWNREKTKKYNLKNFFNMTLEDYNRLVEQQNGLCAICGKVETISNQFGSRPLSVDHDHNTGEVRGLLCSQCNHLLGNAKDSIEILNNAITYLKEKHNVRIY
jgi:hypothetical protein